MEHNREAMLKKLQEEGASSMERVPGGGGTVVS